MLPLLVFEILYYLSEDGRSPFEEWYLSLNASAGLRIATAIRRLKLGNTSNVSPLEKECSNIVSISARVTECISVCIQRGRSF